MSANVPTDSDLVTLLETLLPAPEATLAKARVRGRIMAAAREQLEPRTSPVFGPAGLAAAAASAVVALGSGGAIGASASALPGEPLYHVKLAMEEVKSAVIAVSGDSVAQVVVQEERATQRVAEMEALADRGRAIPQAVADAAAAHSAAAAAAAAAVPEPRRLELNEKRDASQAQRQETLSRVLTQVPSPAQTAIARTIERAETRAEERQEARAAREDDREPRQGARDESRDEAREQQRDDRDSRRDEPPTERAASNGNSGPGSPNNGDTRGRPGVSAVVPPQSGAPSRPTAVPTPLPSTSSRSNDVRPVPGRGGGSGSSGNGIGSANSGGSNGRGVGRSG